MDSAARMPWLDRLMAATSVMVWLAALGLIVRRVRDQIDVWLITTDMGVYFKAAHRLRDGLSPYYQGELVDGFANSYVYPPLLAVVIVPFTFLPDATVRWGFLALTMATLVASVALLGRGFGRTLAWPSISLGAGLLLATSIVRDELVRGNVNLWITLLATASLWYLLRSRFAASGALWGLAIALKPFLAIWVAYLVWRGQWRAAAWTAGSAAALLVGSLLITRPVDGSVLSDWIDVTRYYGEPARTTMADNHSLRAMLERAFTDDGIRTKPWIDSDALFALSYVALIGIVAAIAWIAIRPRDARSGSVERGARLLADFGVVIGAGLLVQPLTQLAHFLVLIPAFAGVAYLAVGPDWSLRRTWLPALAGWAILAASMASPIDRLVLGGFSFNPDDLGGWNVIWSGRMGLLLLLALGLTAFSAVRERREVALAQRATPSVDLRAVPTES